MSEKERILEQLISELDFSFRFYLKKSAQITIRHGFAQNPQDDLSESIVPKLTDWICHQYPLTDCQLESKQQTSFLRLYSQTSVLDVRHELEEGYCFQIPLYDLLAALQTFSGTDWQYRERLEILLSFLQNRLQNSIEAKEYIQVIQATLHLLMAGISSYTSFGLWILEQLFPANTYMLDIVNDNVILVDFPLYKVPVSEKQSANPLFCIEEMGRNGFNVLYDDNYILKCRIRQKETQLKNLCCYFYIERKDKQSYLF